MHVGKTRREVPQADGFQDGCGYGIRRRVRKRKGDGMAETELDA